MNNSKTNLTNCLQHPPPYSFFDTPEFLSTFTHLSGIIATPLNIFGGYAILCHTPPIMASMKWPMFVSHCWSVLFDFNVSFMAIPFILLPYYAVSFLGFMKYFGVPESVIVYIFGTTMLLLQVSFQYLFSLRYLAIQMQKSTWKIYAVRTCQLVFHAGALTALIPLILSEPEQTAALKTVFENLPCLPTHVYQSDIYVFYDNMYIAFFFIGPVFIGNFNAVLLFITLTFKSLLEQTKQGSMSEKTAKLQRTFLIKLIIHGAIPFAIFLPGFYVTVSFFGNYYNQAFNNLMTMSIGAHGIAAAVALLSVYKPYRELVMRTFRMSKTVKDTRPVSLL